MQHADSTREACTGKEVTSHLTPLEKSKAVLIIMIVVINKLLVQMIIYIDIRSR
jgi:hypothetical protein